MPIRRAACLLLATATLTVGACSTSDDPPQGFAPTTEPPTSTTAAPTTTAPSTTTSAALAAAATAPECPAEGRSRRLDGVRVRDYCGPARVVLRVGAEPFDFASGRCIAHKDWFEIHLGVEVAEPSDDVESPRFTSFTMLLGRHPLSTDGAAPAATDGVYHDGVVTFTTPGRTFALDDKTITLTGKRTAGTLAGVALIPRAAEPVPVRGEFACTSEGAIALNPHAIPVPEAG